MLWLLCWIACRATDPGLPPYGGWPVWDELDLEGAADLGHVPRQGPPLLITALRFEDATAGLQLGARGGGNQHGVGVAVVDLDGDGWDDIFVANGVSNHRSGERWASELWRNHAGTFVDVSEASGIRAILDGADLYSVAAGDIDRDGDVDLYVGGQPTNVLLVNRGDGTFVDGTRAAEAAGPPSNPDLVRDGRSKVVSVGDFDNDGWLDLVSASSTLPAPGATLLRNRGDGRFEDRTRDSGITIDGQGHPCAVMFTDYDNDGHRDLWIWNDRGGHTLLHHDGAAWEDFGRSADRQTIRHPMGIDGADIDHDGDLDYYVSNIGLHPLLRNEGDGTFVDISNAAGTRGDYGWGLGFEDFDLDGRADLYVTQEDDREVLAYRNVDGERFDTFAFPRPAIRDPGAAHNVAAAFGDLDHDGRIDAVFAGTDGSPVVIHRNVTQTAGHPLEVRVTDGVGARVVVQAGDLVQFRDISGGASRASVSALSARFGLGPWDGADWVWVVWPDGRRRAFVQVPADRPLVVN